MERASGPSFLTTPALSQQEPSIGKETIDGKGMAGGPRSEGNWSDGNEGLVFKI